ncbi:hypothetical protein TRIATDRAFT_256951 [Trichoderma atroviride IMI 206040]|uniref:Uncharacterized protein n=1 Tax=Hypocrea atroviridis (strain ATCC 20476 / IMI 206040) TaxID=452589 RepID=G9NX91_HYPAI|nr:uncharacterized protein TRIATDRAFT_256951 [Trichoderma atroviride IMI 206040]EHK44702.1 hypothetical protein TRIATDRAFT_256951 [Trichoderma atroviride IMI 206040]
MGSTVIAPNTNICGGRLDAEGSLLLNWIRAPPTSKRANDAAFRVPGNVKYAE